MDEASTGLDPGARRELSQYVHELRDTEGVTIVLTTHILDEAERSDRLVLLHQGKIVAEGTPAELRSRVGGGHVVVLEAADPASLGAKIEAQFGLRPSIMGGEVRIEIDNGHRFITEVVEAFPGAIESVALHKPTLEDVFVHETGASIE
jgi:ABC-2 type transport system ATP-binding protein